METSQPRPPGGFNINPWLMLFLLGLTAILTWRTIQDWLPTPDYDPNARPRTVEARGDLAEDEKSTISLFKAAAPSVAYVTSLQLARDYRSLNVVAIPAGTGSAFVWDNRGHVVTNFHVVRSAQALSVTLADNSTWTARVLGFDQDNDLAVLKIEAPRSRLKPIPVGESHNLQVGQKVFAIGSPFQLDQTLTTGVISGLGREIPADAGEPIRDAIQTDAAINPGNSGGPLLDSAGRLIGVNTAIRSTSGASAGVGFAVPVDTVNRVVPQLIRARKADRPDLGIESESDALVERLLEYGVISEPGVLIRFVRPGSAAAQAGLRGVTLDEDGGILLGDLITAIDGKPVRSSKQLNQALDSHQVGDTIGVTVWRDGKAVELKATLQAMPSKSL